MHESFVHFGEMNHPCLNKLLNACHLNLEQMFSGLHPSHPLMGQRHQKDQKKGICNWSLQNSLTWWKAQPGARGWLRQEEFTVTEHLLCAPHSKYGWKGSTCFDSTVLQLIGLHHTRPNTLDRLPLFFLFTLCTPAPNPLSTWRREGKKEQSWA